MAPHNKTARRSVAKGKKPTAPQRHTRRISRRSTWITIGLLAGAMVLGGLWWATSTRGLNGESAPEASKVLKVQSTTPFQIMIPGYLPKEFDRKAVEIVRHDAGPAGEPLVELNYATDRADGPKVYIREWVPGNPELESLAGSKPIQTKWGKGWLLTHKGLTAIWADVGATRVSVYSPSVDKISKEDLLAMAESLGPASNKQVFSYAVKSAVKDMEPPKPVQVPIGKDGIQEVKLVITPGGYDPIRFAVKKDVPVRVRFSQLGEVGCGNELIFPSDPENLSALRLKDPQDEQTLEFTPDKAGEFQFYCGHRMFRGLFTVQD